MQTQALHIRPRTPDDDAAIVTLANTIYPDYPDTVEGVRYWLEHRDPKCDFYM